MSLRTDTDARRYLDPLALSKIRNMELISRFAVQGFFQGMHKSPFHGLSVEYSDHRPYIQGDEIKFIDWKAYARTDHLNIKRYRQETNVQCHLLVDISESMGYGSGAVRKIDYACYLAAALTYLMLLQNDGVGLVLFNDRIRVRIPAKSQSNQLHPILVALSRIKPELKTDIPSALHQVADSIARRGMMILISDLLNDPEEVTRGLSHLRHMKHDVIVFHVLDDSELRLDFSDMTEFRDSESDARLRVFPESIRDEYKARVAAFVENYRRTCGRAEIDFCALNTSTPLDRALLAYLERRRNLM